MSRMSHKAEKVFMQIGSSVASRPWTSIAVTVLVVFAASAGFFVSLDPKIDQTICGFSNAPALGHGKFVKDNWPSQARYEFYMSNLLTKVPLKK